jgi:hypothetical protein
MVKFSYLCPLAILAGTWLAACQPEFTARNSDVTELRILGVRADPPEANPNFGNDIVYTALVADQTGTRKDVAVRWAYCTLPTPVSELNDVSPQCLFPDGPYIKKFGDEMSQSVTTKLPFLPGENSCNQFGPDLPAPMDGGPPGRPSDPDSTGGFYQPIRLLIINPKNTNAYDFTFAQMRIRCSLPGATIEVAADYQARYRLNANPEIDKLTATTGAGSVDLQTEDKGDSGLVVPRGTGVHLTASYAKCPTAPSCGNGFCEAKEDAMSCPADCMMPKGCSGAETYAYFDLTSRTIVDRREAMRLSWFSNAGAFTDDRTGHTEAEADATTTENTWTAPSTPGSVTMWAVLRDSRGGLTWKSYKIAVQ